MSSIPGSSEGPQLRACSACGHEISAAATKCPACGHPQPANWTRYKNIGWVLMAIVIAIFLISSFANGISTANRASDEYEKTLAQLERCNAWISVNYSRYEECRDDVLGD